MTTQGEVTVEDQRQTTAATIEHQIGSILGIEMGILCEDNTLRTGSGELLLRLDAVPTPIDAEEGKDPEAAIPYHLVISVCDIGMGCFVRSVMPCIIDDHKKSGYFSSIGASNVTWRTRPLVD